MIVSRREALERLSSPENIFGDRSGVLTPGDTPDAPTIPLTPPVLPNDAPVLPNDSHSSAFLESSSALESSATSAFLEDEAVETAAHAAELSETVGLLDLSSLDDLIQNRPRVNYKHKMEAQVAIAETALILGSNRQAGHIFGHTSGMQAGAYREGKSGNQDKHLDTPYKNLRRVKLNDMKERLALKAGRRLKKSLELMSDELLESIKDPIKLSTVAKDMASVIDRIKVQEERSAGDSVHFHIYRPEMGEQTYERIEVGAAVPIDVTPISYVSP